MSGYPTATQPYPADGSAPPPVVTTTAEGDPVVDPLAWPTPPTTGLPVLSAAEQARADALYAQLLPRAQAAYVEYVLARTPHLWQDYMIGKVLASVAP
jgi:hypothetical protein